MGKEIDVRKIMADIERSVDQMSDEEKQLSFVDSGSRGLHDAESMRFDQGILGSIIEFCRTHCRVESFRDLRMPGCRNNPVVLFFKKVIRRLSQFYVEPVVNDQAEFNTNVVSAMDQVQAFIEENRELRAKLVQQERRIAELERQLKSQL